MRKSTVSAALAIVATLSLPANAAKYTCTFSQASAPLKQCSIDPTTTCRQDYPHNLVGLCAASKSTDDSMEAIVCTFSVSESVKNF
jgi:hypothetical protein